MKLTSAQQATVIARGNVLVVAGAGTGKTRALVERCLHCVLNGDAPASLDELLVVTFTEAAAAEMRRRLRDGLEERLRANPRDVRCQEQLALFDAAHIGTLHSFCLDLIRQHFYELDIDPQLTVLAAEETRLLAEDTLDVILNEQYAGTTESAIAVQELIRMEGRGRNNSIRALVLKLHHYSQTLPDPAGWFESQHALFEQPDPAQWRTWLVDGVLEWRADWQETIDWLAAENPVFRECAAVLKGLSPNTVPADMANAMKSICQAAQEKSRPKDRLARQFFDDAEFLFSLTRTDGRGDPLAEDWEWARPQMRTLLRLTRQFSDAFLSSKRELGALDFHDLEQYALRLLWDRSTDRPTAIARQWQDRLRFVFVDEYQDINAAQDKIIQALSREGERANRFLVGDMKQSIYRFRLANPRIFQNYAESWNGESGKVLPLTENFRSREGVLRFVNSLFGRLMRRDVGNVAYDDRAKLEFGAPADRAAFSCAADPAPRVELHLRFKRRADDPEPADAPDELSDLQETDKEARMIALRLRDLKSQRHQIRDERPGTLRAVEWSDMAVLMRSPSKKVESYAREFLRMGVPLVVARGGFYQSLEISDLLNLLRLFDNPLQDLPVLAVLRSPLVGLRLEDLARIRLASPKTHFWMALQRWYQGEKSQQDSRRGGAANLTAGFAGAAELDAFEKVDGFLRQFGRWRRLARQESLARCLAVVLAETHYSDWLLTQERGAQRQGNVRRLLDMAQQFDEFQRQSLFRFLRFVEAEQDVETEPEAAAIPEENAVRLMSIHQSKGLEFPVVAIADLGKAFNLASLREGVILDETYGACPLVKPPQTGKRYPSLAYWLARRSQKRELLGEELRLLYVAMTRACDTLILAATIFESKFDTHWNGSKILRTAMLLEAQSHADWLGFWFAEHCARQRLTEPSDERPLLNWFLHQDSELESPDICNGEAAVSVDDAGDADWKRLYERLAWRYPHLPAADYPAKTSVSRLRQFANAESLEAADLFPPKFAFDPVRRRARSGTVSRTKFSGVDIGSVHHRFLQFVDLHKTGGLPELRGEVDRMKREQILSADEIDLLDLNGLEQFWRSELGRRICAQAPHVHRELPFAARFTTAELAEFQGSKTNATLADEFVVVQGVADLAVILPEEIWLIDFKTDDVTAADLPSRVAAYEPQLKLYARALSRIYGRRIASCWLYFLSPAIAAEVAPGQTSSSTAPDAS